MALLLKHLPALALDCQTTGSHPDRGRLLEIGWAETRASDAETVAPEVEARLIESPGAADIPRRVSAITGIGPEDLRDALPSAEVWAALAEAARAVSVSGAGEPCPAVIHYARFEEPFLRRLHQDHSPERPFPFLLICTHEIARRLFPGLPRRGLRAVAGYLGYSAPELRRASHHVAATVWVWRKMVEMLEKERGIRTLDELRDWLAATPASARTGREWPLARDIRLGLPDRPGVYRMLRSNRDVLYVGKADSLKRRVNSYFQKRTRHAEHTLEMLSQARDLEVTVAGSALEAALLETDEIKRLAPPYNISLRDAGRILRFCSPDFRSLGPETDADHPVGPLASDELSAFPVLRDLLENGGNGGDDSDIPSKALALPAEYSPDRECFVRGFERFSGEHGGFLRDNGFPGAFLALGARLWRERGEGDGEAGEEAESSTEEYTIVDSTTGEWTPETVAGALEGVILRGAWMLRRARWFCLLTESVLAFREPRAGEGRLLVFERGVIVRRGDAAPDGEIPVPPGCSRPGMERRRAFDIPAWDRMRVLTSEMRRIIAKGGDAALRVSPGAALSREKLERALEWV